MGLRRWIDIRLGLASGLIKSPRGFSPVHPSKYDGIILKEDWMVPITKLLLNIISTSSYVTHANKISLMPCYAFLFPHSLFLLPSFITFPFIYFYGPCFV